MLLAALLAAGAVSLCGAALPAPIRHRQLPARAGSQRAPRQSLGTVSSDDAWTLVWEDDFSGPGLNASNWVARNNESHCEPCEPELYMAANVAVANGTLVLTTQRQSLQGPGGVHYNFSSGWVDSLGLFSQQYGRFAVSARLPPQNATAAWPAHWLMPTSTACWPTGGEVDIMEGLSDPDLPFWVYGSYRWGTQCGDDNQLLPGAVYGPEAWDAAYHVFGVDWNQTALTFWIDYEAYETKTAAEVILPSSPMYIILNTALFWAPDDSAVLPAQHIIDWVRVYSGDNATTAVERAPVRAAPASTPALTGGHTRE
jgi:beta-glucanase (GH16 family)